MFYTIWSENLVFCFPYWLFTDFFFFSWISQEAGNPTQDLTVSPGSPSKKEHFPEESGTHGHTQSWICGLLDFSRAMGNGAEPCSLLTTSLSGQRHPIHINCSQRSPVWGRIGKCYHDCAGFDSLQEGKACVNSCFICNSLRHSWTEVRMLSLNHLQFV